MNPNQVEESIKRAKPGITQYLNIMRLFSQTNVARDQNFQTKYKAFYRVRQRPEEWYKTYFNYMENLKGHKVNFSEVLRYFKERLNRYEPSFSSKLVATHDPTRPVWDKYVLKNIGLVAPSYNSPSKFDDAVAIYQRIEGWFCNYERSYEGAMIIRKFDELVPNHVSITNTKKIDFVPRQ